MPSGLKAQQPKVGNCLRRSSALDDTRNMFKTGDTLNARERKTRRNREERQKKREARCYVWGMGQQDGGI